MQLSFGSQEVLLKPHFEILSGGQDSENIPGIVIENGEYFFINSNGERQKLDVVTASA